MSFDIAHGETVALLGPSGCGKTTILRVIAGFEAPDTGTLRIAGADMARKRPYERNIGLLFQHYALFPHMTVAANVAYGLRHRGFPEARHPAAAWPRCWTLVKLPGYGERLPNQLSGGQQQRVALARALATRPGVVLLDEPLSALDAKLRQELRAELRDVLAAVGSSAIVVTHDQEEAMSLGERVFVMNRGRIVQQGTPDDIYARPQAVSSPSSWAAPTGSPAACGDAATFQTTCGLTLQVASRACRPRDASISASARKASTCCPISPTAPGRTGCHGEVVRRCPARRGAADRVALAQRPARAGGRSPTARTPAASGAVHGRRASRPMPACSSPLDPLLINPASKPETMMRYASR